MSNGWIIYIHGRGFGATHSTKWQKGLTTGLERAGYAIKPEELEGRLVSVSYSAYLDPAVEIGEQSLLPATARGVNPSVAQALKHRQSELKRRIGSGFREDTVDLIVRQAAANDKLAEQVIGQRYKDVKRYVTDTPRRHRILAHILDQLPDRTDRCVLIGHSLGSVIAMDLVRHWPKDVYVDLLVTMGSPASLGPMKDHLKGLASSLPRELIGGWLNVYDPSDPVTGGSGLSPYFKEDVLDHRVQNGGLRGNHGADRHLEHITTGIAVGPHVSTYLGFTYPELRVADRPSEAALMFDAALASWLRDALIHRQPERSSRRARRVIAAETLRVKANAHLDLNPDEDLRHHVVELSDLVTARLDQEALLKLQMQLRSAALFAPFALDIPRDDIHASMMQLAEEVGWGPDRIQKVDRAMREARESQKTQQNKSGALVLGGAAIAVAALATGGFALAAAPGVAGAAFITSGLAGLGSLAGGGMAAGLFMTAGAGAASSLLAQNALTLLSALETREEIVKIHAEALVHRWEGRTDKARQLREELRDLQGLARREARLHAAVDEGSAKSSLEKDWREKEAILKLAVKALS